MRERVFIDRLSAPWERLRHAPMTGGILLLLATVVAMVWANSAWAQHYMALWQQRFVLGVGPWRLDLSLHHLVNDGLMAVFFFVVGLELKREMLVGELARPKDALLPLGAALGGMVVPALFFAVFNAGGPGAHGWGIPMATDIAFALGVLALLGDRVPVWLKLFLTTLAVADDLGAVLVIAFFYTDGIAWVHLGWAAAFYAVMWVANRAGVRNPWVYAALGIGGLWTAMLASGVHATIAGVLAAFAMPATSKADGAVLARRMRAATHRFAEQVAAGKAIRSAAEVEKLAVIDRLSSYAHTPLQRLEQVLHPWVTFMVLPLFALANAGVVLPADALGVLTSPVAVGVGLGLLLGKPIGVVLASWCLVRFGGARLGAGVTWRHMVGVGLLAGIGFTMSLFVNELAFADPALGVAGKLGILGASALAAVGGYLWLAGSKRSSSSR